MSFTTGRLLCLMTASLVGVCRIGACEGLSYAQFCALSQEGQRDLILAELQSYRESLANLHIIVTTRKYNAVYQDGKVGDTLKVSPTDRVEFLRARGSYLLVTTRGNGRSEEGFLFESKSGYNAETGVSRMLVDHSRLNNVSAKIAMKQDPIVTAFRYGYHLAGAVNEREASYQELILDQGNAIEITQDDDAQQIVVRFSIELKPNGRSVKRYGMWLDPSKRFLLTRMHYRWDVNADSYTGWQESHSQVIESEKVGDVWIPMRLRYIAMAHQLGDSRATVYDSVVDSVEVGTVSSDEVALDFPPETYVRDLVQGITYTTTADGGKRGVTEVSALLREANEPRQSAGSLSLWASVLLVVLFLLYLGVRLSGRQRSS